MKTRTFCKIFPFLFVLISVVSYAQEALETWMPDSNLRQAVREELGLPDNIRLTQQVMNQLRGFDASERQITDLTGLEHAMNLTHLSLGVNEIQDLSSLAGLIRLEALAIFVNPLFDLSPLANLVNLKSLDAGGCQIANIQPLANLRKLEMLRLHYNQIQDITPLSNLTRLTELWLNANQIADIRPLENLTRLKALQIQNNPITDYSSLDVLSLTHFEYDEFCVFPGRSIQEWIQNRNFPSVFNAWNDILNRPTLSYEAQLAHHDLIWSPEFRLRFQKTNDGLQLAGNLNDARKQREALLEINPNMIFILDLPMQAADPNSPFYRAMYDNNFPWIRDKAGNRVPMSDKVGEYEYPSFLIDFTHPDGQDIIVQQAIAVSRCGLYDGIFFDLWSEDWYILEGHRTYEAEQRARTIILQRIRAEVEDDFLILVNPNRSKPTRAAPYINGLFMETVRDYEGGYTYAGLREIEETLLWAEEHLQSPRVNCLEGWGVETEAPDSPTNLRWMRAFTTMSLTHSDGYVLYITGIRHPIHEHDWSVFEITHKEKHDQGIEHNHHHDHYWYNFWDADLGQPIGGKAQRYRNIEGLFIREFTNGWAVYNRSGKEQQIEFSETVSGVASGVKDKRSHVLSDLDGEIYLKTVVQVVPGEYPPLYWIDAKTDTLQRLVDTEVKNLVSETQNATSLTVDTANEKLYWTEKTSQRTGNIQSANLDGNPNVQIVKDLTSEPLDIALDTIGGKLYLSNAWGKIQRMNLDGSNFESNLITGLKTPQNLVLDTTSGQLYWTEQTGKTTGKIQRANLDGNPNVQLVKELTSAPRGMTLDAVNRKLYLTNAWGKLQRMNLNGSNFESNFITGLASPGQVAVDVVGGKVYWTEQGKLRRADLNGENIQDVITGLGELADIGLGIDSAGEMGVAAAPAAIRTVVEQTQLLANYPNPFNPETWIPYQLSEPAEVTVRIYSVKGILVRTLALGQIPTGIYQDRSRAAYWDGRNDVGESVASGLYFYTLTAGDFTATRKMLIRK